MEREEAFGMPKAVAAAEDARALRTNERLAGTWQAAKLVVIGPRGHKSSATLQAIRERLSPKCLRALISTLPT